MSAPADLAAWFAAARLRHAAVEGTGLFWIAAELGILFLVYWGRCHLLDTPNEPKLKLTAGPRKLLVASATFLILLVAIVGVRLSLIPSAPTIQDAIAFEQQHMLLWAAFVTLWVALEIAIVYQGTRAYERLRLMLSPSRSLRRPALSSALLPIVLTLSLSAAASAQLAAIDNAILPTQNALYFYLRVAGIVWIGVEWIAAYVLVKSYRLLRASVPR